MTSTPEATAQAVLGALHARERLPALLVHPLDWIAVSTAVAGLQWPIPRPKLILTDTVEPGEPLMTVDPISLRSDRIPTAEATA